MKFEQFQVPAPKALLDLNDRIAEILRPVQEHLRKSFARLNVTMNGISEYFEAVEAQNAILAHSVRTAVAKLPANHRTALNYCAKNAWYLSVRNFTFIDLENIATLIKEQQLDKAESFLLAYARSIVDSTLEKAQTYWPRRKQILADAFNAHRQGTYSLSITSLLAQADGIFFDITFTPGRSNHKHDSLFGRTHRTKLKSEHCLDYALSELKHRDLTLEGTLQELFLSPFKEPSTIGESTRSDTTSYEISYDGPLNRHAVLHGRDVSYPTENNSLRTVMLINCLVELKETLDFIRDSGEEYQCLLNNMTKNK